MRFSNGNILLLMVFGVFILMFGCTQNEDVVKPLTSSTLTLDPDFLPNLDSIYYYELWMVKVQNENDDYTDPGAEFTSVRKFLWDNEQFQMYDLDSNELGFDVDLEESWYAYDYIVLTVENIGEAFPNEPSGVFMLAEEVRNEEIPTPVEMKFPVSMFETLGNFFIGTPTNDTNYVDSNFNWVRVSEEENKGLWICSRFLTERFLWDTLAVLSLDTVMVPEFDTLGKYDVDTIGIEWPPDSTFEVLIDTVYFGYDTFQHRRIDIVWIDTVDTNYDYLLYPSYLIDSMTTEEYPYPLGRIPYFEYSGPLDGLPDIAPFGWRYNAWLVLEEPEVGDPEDPDANSDMNLDKIVPFGAGALQQFTGYDDWGVIPLGSFDGPVGMDNSNPYIENREVPQFPGEDFVNEDASPRFDNLNLRRTSNDAWGFILVGMEPDPGKVNINSTTNFPLFFLSQELGRGASDEFRNYSTFLPVINIDVTMRE